MRITIIDGYIDEPTCLGVPFYVSTYVRYAAGAALLAGADTVLYRTIDQLRESAFIAPASDAAVLIAGNPVPGKYLGGLPIKEAEFRMLAQANPDLPIYAGGPLERLPVHTPDNMVYVSGDIEHVVYAVLKSGAQTLDGLRTLEELEAFAEAGAAIVQQHPRFPDLIAEIETGRGCPRREHCSFCVEGRHRVEFRSIEGIRAEVAALYRAGIRHFRLSKQADLLSYQADLHSWRDGFAQPRPDRLEALYAAVREAAPELETLHLDNVNPGTIARYPEESARILHTIATYNTPGDTAAFGMESADPALIAVNNLKASPEQIRFAVELVNQTGGSRTDGIPRLLPGINIIKGLPGETRDTFRLNYEFLLDLLKSGLLLRRINIRQLTVSAHTAIGSGGHQSSKNKVKLDAIFRRWRKQIRDEIDIPMLRLLFPAGTVFHNLIIEQQRGDWSLARNIGTYPIVLNIPGSYPLYSKISAFVVGHRERSLIGLPHPLHVNSVPVKELQQIPGMHKKAGGLFARGNIRPEDFAESPVYQAIRASLC